MNKMKYLKNIRQPSNTFRGFRLVSRPFFGSFTFVTVIIVLPYNYKIVLNAITFNKFQKKYIHFDGSNNFKKFCEKCSLKLPFFFLTLSNRVLMNAITKQVSE